MPRIELKRTKRTKPESTFISEFASDVTSQYGEDGMIAKVFEIIGVSGKWCADVGAWDGKYLSNTWDLLTNRGWRGVLAEGNADRATALAKAYEAKTGHVFVRSGYVGW